MATESVFSADHCEQGGIVGEQNRGQNAVGSQYMLVYASPRPSSLNSLASGICPE